MDVICVEDPSDGHLAEGAVLASWYRREVFGEKEPPYPEAELIWELTPAPGVVRTRLWLALDNRETVGAALQRLPLQEPISWLAWLVVNPARRRRGIGRTLLTATITGALDDNRRRIGWTTPLGNRAATALSMAAGASTDVILDHNRLWTADVDRASLAVWVGRARERGADYSLVGWDGACPESLVEDYAELQSVMDDAPGVDRELVTAATVDRIRAAEARWLPRGPYWRLCARHHPTGELVGFTELQVPHTRPGVAEQGDTGVRGAHRNRGIGRWLKAVNMLRLLDQRPDVSMVNAVNAGSNQPMLKINREMGFRTAIRLQRWYLRV